MASFKSLEQKVETDERCRSKGKKPMQGNSGEITSSCKWKKWKNGKNEVAIRTNQRVLQSDSIRIYHIKGKS